jgi:hypothetical protein
MDIAQRRQAMRQKPLQRRQAMRQKLWHRRQAVPQQPESTRAR